MSILYNATDTRVKNLWGKNPRIFLPTGLADSEIQPPAGIHFRDTLIPLRPTAGNVNTASGSLTYVKA